MSNEDKGHMPQSSLWSSSEMAECWQQDGERRRQDMAEATQRMLEAAGLKPGDHVLHIAGGPADRRTFAGAIAAAARGTPDTANFPDKCRQAPPSGRRDAPSTRSS